ATMRIPSRRLAVLALVSACAARAPLPEPPTGVTTVAVAPVENKTGNALVVAGDSYVAKWIGIKRRTVPDILHDELRAALRERGFTVADAGWVPKLRVTIMRFEPDLPLLAQVDAGVVATLTAPDSTEKWRLDQPHRLISTAGSPKLEAAYETAARTL